MKIHQRKKKTRSDIDVSRQSSSMINHREEHISIQCANTIPRKVNATHLSPAKKKSTSASPIKFQKPNDFRRLYTHIHMLKPQPRARLKCGFMLRLTPIGLDVSEKPLNSHAIYTPVHSRPRLDRYFIYIFRSYTASGANKLLCYCGGAYTLNCVCIYMYVGVSVEAEILIERKGD